MKFVIAALASVVLASSAFAGSVIVEGQKAPTVKLENGSSHVKFLEGKIISATTELVPMCSSENPEDVVCLGLISEATINVRFDLGGCMDQLGPVGVNVIRDDIGNSETIIISAVHIANKKSMVTMCTKQPSEMVAIKIRGSELNLQSAKKLVQFIK